MKNKINIGDKFTVYIKGWPGYSNTYQRIEDNTDKTDGRGTIILSTLEEIQPNTQTKIYKLHEKTMVVEQLWFEQKKRVIKKLR